MDKIRHQSLALKYIEIGLFTAKEVAKSEWASAGEEGETVLNNAVNYSESGVSERR